MDPTRGNVNLGMGGMQVHGIGSRMLMHKDVIANVIATRSCPVLPVDELVLVFHTPL